MRWYILLLPGGQILAGHLRMANSHYDSTLFSVIEVAPSFAKIATRCLPTSRNFEPEVVDLFIESHKVRLQRPTYIGAPSC